MPEVLVSLGIADEGSPAAYLSWPGLIWLAAKSGAYRFVHGEENAGFRVAVGLSVGSVVCIPGGYILYSFCCTNDYKHYQEQKERYERARRKAAKNAERGKQGQE
jgi:hypothetical protein